MLRRQAGEDGQVLPLLAMVVITLVAGGFMLLQFGHATILEAEATTVADAAALAAADELADQLRESLRVTAFNQRPALNQAAATRAARTYAERNGGTLRDISYSGLEVQVQVTTDDALSGQGLEAVRGRRGTATARAEVEIAYAFGPPGNPGRAAVDQAQIDRVSQEAGVPVRSDSALVTYQGTGYGDVAANLLAPQMKASIAKLEALMDAPLILSSAYRSAAYQADLCQRVSGPCAPPGRSMHQYGLAVDAANWAAALPYLEAAGLCQPLPSNDAVHLSHVSGRECGGRTGVLGSGGAFGGNPASFATFEVHLIP